MAQVLAIVPTAGLDAVRVAAELALASSPPSARVSVEPVVNALGRLNAVAVSESAQTTLQGSTPPLADPARDDRLRGPGDSVSDDCERATDRVMRAVSQPMNAAKFPLQRDLAGLDFEASPVDRKLIHQLAAMSFNEGAHNAALAGGPGTGKTHLTIAIGCPWPPNTASPAARPLRTLVGSSSMKNACTGPGAADSWFPQPTATHVHRCLTAVPIGPATTCRNDGKAKQATCLARHGFCTRPVTAARAEIAPQTMAHADAVRH